jgi:glycerol kinase
VTKHILAIDQGTTSSRAILFDGSMRPAQSASQEFAQHFPQSGWVEHAPTDILETVLATARDTMARSGLAAADVAAIGITNQRETTLVWDRETGEPLHNAIVWQDRRTADMCHDLRRDGAEETVVANTGLLLDPYFSATKIKWILDVVPDARARARAGSLAFGTVDTFLIWHLSGRKRHVTDATNASRTMLYNIHKGCWDPDILALLDIPESMLPEVLDSAAEFGTTDPDVFGAAVPILGVAGDQQAATIGQACFGAGMLKSTYGTGCFALLNTGPDAVSSQHRMLTTIAYRLNGAVTYALEGSIFIAGAAVQWMRDGLGLIENADQTGALAAEADDTPGVYLVPAFTGLGAPHWDANARGALYGLTRATGPKEIARAVLESVCFQTADLMDAMRADWSGAGDDMILRVDGGMVANDWAMQRLSDLLGVPVDRPDILETTALGAAWLAGQFTGEWPDAEGFAKAWHLDRRFEPSMSVHDRQQRIAGWRDAIRRTRSDF